MSWSKRTGSVCYYCVSCSVEYGVLWNEASSKTLHGPIPRGLWLETHTWETSAAGGGQTTGADEIIWDRQVEKEAVDSAQLGSSS